MGVPELLRAIAITLGVTKVTVNVFADLNVDAIYFDIASLIHTCAQETYRYGAFLDVKKQEELARYSDIELRDAFRERLRGRLESAIRRAQPRKLVYVAMDGVPVYAKTVQQRWRRFASLPSILFDSNTITPGTVFLDDLADWLRRWIEDFTSQQDEENQVSYFLSDHTVPGEAEHKIADVIRERTAWSNVIHGLDNDLFLISLLIPSRIYLWNEQPTKPDADAKSTTITTRPGNTNTRSLFPQVVDVEAARGVITDRLKTPEGVASFVVAVCILGNDFIPRNKSLEDFVGALRLIVDQLKQGDIVAIERNTNHTINTIRVLWKPFLKLLIAVAKEENILIVAAAQRTHNSLVAKATNGVRFSYEAYRHLYHAMQTAKDGEDFESIVSRYLEMVAFVVLYYAKGSDAVNKRLYYPYYYAPLLADLASIAPRVVTAIAEKKIWLNTASENAKQYLNPYSHLVAVLPQRSFYLMPKTVVRTLENKIRKESRWNELYPTTVERDVDGYSADHVGPVFVPWMSPETAESINVPPFHLTPQQQLFIPTDTIETTSLSRGDEYYIV